jgi:hypothetical protein
MAANTDGTITFNATETYERLALLTGAVRGMVSEMRAAGQTGYATRLNGFVDQWGITQTSITPVSHTRPLPVGRPPGQPITNSGQFGAKTVTKKKATR